jgi:hypothetical protein
MSRTLLGDTDDFDRIADDVIVFAPAESRD